MSEREFTLLQARQYLGDLVIDAQAGNVTVITRYGKPAAVIAPADGAQVRTVTLASGGSVTLSMTCRPLGLSPGDREAVFGLIDAWLAWAGDYEAANPPRTEPGRDAAAG